MLEIDGYLFCSYFTLTDLFICPRFQVQFGRRSSINLTPIMLFQHRDVIDNGCAWFAIHQLLCYFSLWCLIFFFCDLLYSLCLGYYVNSFQRYIGQAKPWYPSAANRLWSCAFRPQVSILSKRLRMVAVHYGDLTHAGLSLGRTLHCP